jgi:hypothetical protein
VLETTKYDPVQQKKLFKNGVELLRQIPSPSTPEFIENSFKMNPHQPRITRESPSQMECSGQTQKSINLWFQLFSNISNNENITNKLQRTIKMALGVEGNLKEFIVSSLPKRNSSRVQRKKR